MKKWIIASVLIAASACLAKEYFYGTRIDTTTTSNTTYIGEAASNHQNFSESNAVWKIIKIDSDGNVYNLEVSGNMGYVAIWTNIPYYATNTTTTSWK